MPFVQRDRGVALSAYRYPRINWRSPYARGLLAAYSGDDTRELVTGVTMARNAAHIGLATSYGPGAGLRAAQSSLWTTARRLPTTEFTMLWVGHRFSSPGADASFGGITYDSANSPPYVIAEIKTTSGGAPQMTYNNNGTLVNLAASAQAFGPSVLSMRIRHGAQDLRFNGVQAVANSAAFTSFSSTSTARFEVGDSLNTRNPNANCAGLLMWARYLSDAELFALEEDWRLVLEPQEERVFYTMPSGAADLLGSAAQSSTAASAPVVVQTHVLVGSGATSGTVASTGEILSSVTLAGAGSGSSTTASAGAVTQTHVLAAAAISAATGTASGTVTQAHALVAADAASATATSAGAGAQTHVLAGAGAQSSTQAASGTVTSTGTWTGAPAVSETVASAAAIAQDHVLTAADAVASGLLTTAQVTQVHVLTAAGAVSSTQASGGAVDTPAPGALVGSPAASSTSASAGSVTQTHLLAGASASSATALSSGTVSDGTQADVGTYEPVWFRARTVAPVRFLQ